ncbi:fluoride efflux transporter CrcB [Sporohalobacter salinus]|uniref:fluoride efflux transporter CrcB n=1 Tax=Sporohalobacter salinus TaxID=1494606 RepID=UPI0019614982|nr:fluoride efflux transporter CrcB [Sporohalobacter salinus]MBM7624950.1 CrcB protein [Sporohalobacter salinus]
MLKLLSIGLGGFLGAIGRYLIGNGVENFFKGSFPYGTLAVNLIGCFLLGFIFTLTLERQIINPIVRAAITTGFLGALTTFSTFSYETLSLLNGGCLILALSNILFNIIPGLIICWVGITLANLI